MVRILFVVCLILVRVGSSVVIQVIFSNASFDKPLFLTYFSTTLFSIYLLGLLIIPRWRRSLAKSRERTPLVLVPSQVFDDESPRSTISEDERSDMSPIVPQNLAEEPEIPINFRKVW
jgi:hypothetical protein